MFCSNCRNIQTNFGSHETARCEKGHNFCEKCMLQADDKCMLCEGRMFDNYSYRTMPISLAVEEQHNWTPAMIGKWTKWQQNWLFDNESSESANSAPSDDYNAGSINLLYYRGDAYEIESRLQNDMPHRLDSEWIQELPKTQAHSSRSSPKGNKPRHFVKLNYREDRPELVRKDTRQSLVDKTTEEIREDIFTAFKNDTRSHIIPEQFHTVGVSTESPPRLRQEEPSGVPMAQQESKESIIKSRNIEQNDFNGEPQEFLVLNVDTSNTSAPQMAEDLKKKNAASSIDLRLQQIMGTILESVVEEPPTMTEDQRICKLLREKFSHLPPAKLEEILSSVYNKDDNSNVTQTSTHGQSVPTGMSVMSNSGRAFYKPPTDNQAKIVPCPQFQMITFRNLKASCDLQQRDIIDAGTLNIPRSPVICPISSCQRAFFVSDFTKHIAVDHTKVPIERILSRQCKNFFLDPKLIHFGVSRCQFLLLISDKIKNLGHGKFKDFIPILVMTTKVSLLELCCSQYRSHSEEVKNSKQHFIMLWLTGIMPTQLPIFFSLTVWARSGCLPTCQFVYSGRLYSVRNSQIPEEVRKSGQMLLLSENQVDLLTNRGRHMLELQIAVH